MLKFLPTSLQWTILLLSAALCAILVIGAHVANLELWSQPENMIVRAQTVEHIMGTHDAYHWLAGARGFGVGADSLLAGWARFASEMTGLGVGQIGFWSPPFAAVLVALVMVGWAWSLGALEAGLLAGLITSLSPGFFFRTRLSYYDTDQVTLLAPVLLSFMLAHWLGRHLDPRPLGPLVGRFLQDLPWYGRLGEADALPLRLLYWLPVLAGVFGQVAGQWHNSIFVYAKIVLVLALLLVLVQGRRERLAELLWGVALFGLALTCGVSGGVAAVLLAGVHAWRPQAFAVVQKPWLALVVALLLLLFTGVLDRIYTQAVWFVSSYVKTSASLVDQQLSGGMVYPGVTQSIIEAQDVALSRVLSNIHPWTAVGAVGILGFVATMIFRPQMVLLLPLLLFSLMAFVFGVRTTMFGGPAVGLGLGVPLVYGLRWLLRGFSRQIVWSFLGCTLAAVVLAYPSLMTYVRVAPTPIMSQGHAEGLVELENVTPDNAMIWTWWDWGYATNYYGLRKSFADGANHGGPVIFALGQVMASTSLRQANQLMHYLALHDNDPRKAFAGMSSEEVMAFIERLRHEDMGYETSQPTYVVVSTDDVRLVPWIAYYGSWDPERREGTHAWIRSPQAPLNFDEQEGVLYAGPEEKAIALSSITELLAEGPYTQEYRTDTGLHLFVVPDSYTVLLLDAMAHESLILRLLRADPQDDGTAQYFRLVYDGLPEVRIYEVL